MWLQRMYMCGNSILAIVIQSYIQCRVLGLIDILRLHCLLILITLSTDQHWSIWSVPTVMLDWISWSEQPHACRCMNWVIHWDCYRYSHARAASGAQQASMATANTLQCQPITWASCWGYGRQESLQTFYWICSPCNQIHHGDSMTWSMISMFCR
jgi:hypothetical protein